MDTTINSTTDSAIYTTTLPSRPAPINYTEDVSRVEYALIGSALVAVATIGTFFNGMAIAVFLRYRELRSPTNSFVIALCVCDFFMSAIGAPLPAYYAFMNSTIPSGTLCSVDAFTVYFLSCTSIYLLAAISVDRYFIIVKPTMSLVITQKIATSAICVCFCFGFFWSLMPLVGWNGYSLEGIGVACSVTWNRTDALYNSFIIALFLACFLGPLLVMAFCYLSIIFSVKKIFRGAIMKNLKKHYRIECQMIKTVIFMIALFAVSWLPYATVSFSVAFGSPFNISRLVETVPALIAKSSCIWNPIVYVSMNSHFRAGFLSLIPCTKRAFPREGSRDEYDVGENHFSRESQEGEAKVAGGGAVLKPGSSVERKNDPTKLGLASTLYAGKVSSTTSFVSADSERSPNRCPSENPLLAKAVSDYSIPVINTPVASSHPKTRRASDSTGLKHSSYGNFPCESRQERSKKRNILRKLKRSKLLLTEVEQTNKVCPDSESTSNSLSDTVAHSSSYLSDKSAPVKAEPKPRGAINVNTAPSMSADMITWLGQSTDSVTAVVTKSWSQPESVTKPDDSLRRSSGPETVTLLLEGRLSTQC